MTARPALTLLRGGRPALVAPVIGTCAHDEPRASDCPMCLLDAVMRYDELRTAALRACETLKDNGASYFTRLAALEHLELVATRGQQ